jgi:DNA polymerase III delta subunit
MLIIHGDDVLKSQKRVDEEIARSKNTHRVDAKSLSAQSIPLLFESQELFADKKTIVIDNGKGISKTALEALVNQSIPSEVHLVLWHTAVLDSRFIKKFQNPIVEIYSLPKYYFSFLDGIIPHNGKLLHKLYKSLLESNDVMQVFYALSKRVRQLMIIKLKQEKAFEELAKMSSWQLQKLQTQSKMWSLQDLAKLQYSLYLLESGLKTSSLATNLENSIDILLISELQ